LESDNLAIFMQEAQQIMRRLEAASLEDNPTYSLNLMRDLHTLKGLARSFGLSALARSAHDMEDRLIREPQSSFEALLTVWQSHRDVAATLGLESLQLSQRDKEEDLLLVCGLQLARHPEPPSEHWQLCWQDYIQSLFIRFDELVSSVEEGLTSVARQMDKPMPRIIIEGGEIGIRRSIQGKLLGGLNHILRNALDHGLELPEERRIQNKSEQGSITLLVQFRERILIEIFDDGRGLNLVRIRDRALEKGLITADQTLSDEQLAQFVFTPGFSTKASVNDISGRGIGMDAVQAAIRQMGGQIRIVWRSRRTASGFREGIWQISLPRRYGFHEVPS
jgi:chemotaxis protein histidine kinase CheA